MRRWGFFLMLVVALGGCTEKRVERCKQMVADQMKDPQSVQFREVKDTGTNGRVSFEYNAKNGHGAYTGFERAYCPVDRDGYAMNPVLE